MPVGAAASRQISQANTVGPVDQRVKNPVLGTQGANFASLFIATAEAATTPAQARAGVGAGFGLGVGVNNGQKQYFLAVRGFGEVTPNNRFTVSAERVTSDAPVVGRGAPTVTTTAGTQPVVQLRGKLGPLDVVDTTAASASNFLNTTAGVNVNFAGATNTLTQGLNGTNYVALSNSYQRIDNTNKPLDKSEVDMLKRDGIDATRLGLTGPRPIPSVDRNIPTLLSSALAIGPVAADGKPPANPIISQASVTATFPIPGDSIPAPFKAIIDRIEEAQRYPDKSKLQQVLADFKASPQLMGAFRKWEQQELGKAIAAQAPPPDWFSQLGAAIGGAVAGWHLPDLGGAAEGLGEGIASFLEFLKAINGNGQGI